MQVPFVLFFFQLLFACHWSSVCLFEFNIVFCACWYVFCLSVFKSTLGSGQVFRQLFAGNPILPVLLLAGQQPFELPDGDERADDQQEGGWHDRPAEEGARGEGEIHTEVRRHFEKVALLRRNPVKNHNKGGAGTQSRAKVVKIGNLPVLARMVQ